MSKATLTGRERVNRAFARQDHDRIPRHESFWNETIERWQNEGIMGDAQAALDHLGSDLSGLCWAWPKAFADQRDLVRQDKETMVFRDGNGALLRYWRGKAGTPEHLGFDCDSREKWEKVYKPAFLAVGLQVDPEAAKRNYARARAKDRWAYLAGVESFECTRSLMGDAITMVAMAEDPEWVRDVSETFTTVLLRNLDAVMATGIEPDGLWALSHGAGARLCGRARRHPRPWRRRRRAAASARRDRALLLRARPRRQSHRGLAARLAGGQPRLTQASRARPAMA